MTIIDDRAPHPMERLEVPAPDDLVALRDGTNAKILTVHYFWPAFRYWEVSVPARSSAPVDRVAVRRAHFPGCRWEQVPAR
jgi:hypothetical protein